jgi:hypothetical protein
MKTSHTSVAWPFFVVIALVVLSSGFRLSLRAAAPPAKNAPAPPAKGDGKLFTAFVPVLRHPRCMNCHSLGDFPRQGDDGHPNGMNVRRGPEGHGVTAEKCSTCHQDHNLAGEHLPPGAPWGCPTQHPHDLAGSDGCPDLPAISKQNKNEPDQLSTLTRQTGDVTIREEPPCLTRSFTKVDGRPAGACPKSQQSCPRESSVLHQRLALRICYCDTTYCARHRRDGCPMSRQADWRGRRIHCSRYCRAGAARHCRHQLKRALPRGWLSSPGRESQSVDPGAIISARAPGGVAGAVPSGGAMGCALAMAGQLLAQPGRGWVGDVHENTIPTITHAIRAEGKKVVSFI